ncbi:MAG: aldo/keto reductase [Pseudomonadota bacterium]
MTDAEIGLGFALLGTTNAAPISDADAEAIFATAWDLGIRRFDTAPLYGGGLSEERLGRLLCGLPRNEYVLSSKTGRFRDYARAVTDPKGNPGDWHDYSAEATRRSVEASLERLGTDRLDIVFVHDCDAHIDGALEGALPELRRMQQEGIAGAVGCGSNVAATHEALLEAAELDVLMVAGRLTLLDQSAAGKLLALAEARGAVVELAAPFNSGILAAGPDEAATRFDYSQPDQAIRARAREIERICAIHNVSLRRAALHYPIAHQEVSRLVLGIVEPDGLRENLADAATPVPNALWEALEALGIPNPLRQL